ncbi:MAG: transglutaminase domain-containing protein [Labilithrix sp.]|nr:transglutaminase domain-containing protein [Labilithrix sp.]
MTRPLALRFTPALGATAVVGLVGATRPLGATTRAIALACLVAAWGAAALFERPSVRARASVVAAIAAATAAGQVDAGLPYGAACLLLLLGCLAAMRAARSPGTTAAARPSLATAALLAVVTASVAAGLVAGLPRLAARIEQRIRAMLGVDGAEATAFSTTMVLGATRGMLQSDAIVMRIEGPRPEYLRGAVYDRYAPPYWLTTERGSALRAVAATGARAPATTRVTLVRGAPEGNDMRWFLPAGACDLRVSSGKVEIDAFGVARRARGDSPPALSLRTSDCATPPAPALPPTPLDLDVPEAVRRSLAPIAGGWTASATTAREKLEAISRELGRFEYSLAVPRTTGVDPVVDFVTVHREGHCEMFASAMVLMARTQGIPARVVGGYRVTEVNPLTGRAVVRDRDAHAWVEAWVDGAWRGWDPTPASESFGRGAGALDHAGDLVALALERVVAALTALGLLGTAAVLAGVAAVLAGVRWLGGRVRARRRRPGDARAPDLPLPCFEELADALAGAGHARGESEPIEAFARRLAAVDASWARAASEALLVYARHRYGGVGEEAAVARSIDRAARAVRSAAP